MKKLLIPLIVMLGFCMNTNAQEKSNKEIRGDKYAFRYDFDKAIIAYTHTKLLSTEGQRSLASSYQNTNQMLKAVEAYSTLVHMSKGVIPEDYYNYSMVLKANGNDVQSDEWMEKFVSAKPNDLRAKDYVMNQGERKYLLADDGKYDIKHLTMNSSAEEFGPAYFNNKIVFASSRSCHTATARKYNWTHKPFWDMYIAEVIDGQFKNIKQFNKKLNGKWHDGPASFSNNGTFMAFTRNHYHDKSKDKVVELQLWFSSFIDNKWQKPVPFVLNGSDYSVGQPCLSSDGNTMYFTSDMPGGYGGADLYRSTRNAQGIWGTAINLGDKINTEGDELFPFVEEKNNMFFFASNGRFGLGGLDVFMCQMNGTDIGSAYNAGFPLNSRQDDFAVIVNDKMSEGYFTSNRVNGSGGDDLYSLGLLKWNKNPESTLTFFVDAPKNIPIERTVREIFPLRNYIFFDLGSTNIPDRYVLLSKAQVKDFKEEQVEMFVPKNLSGRSARQMIVYYNIINILGDRMVRNPSSTITLVGSSEKGQDDALAMAESVRQYLISIFMIDPARINTEGRNKPKLPSEQPGQIGNAALYLQGDRRVSIESNAPALLMEFQSGPYAALKPVEVVTVQEAPVESYVSFSIDHGQNAINSWAIEIEDNQGNVQSYGPYTEDQVSIPGKSILGTHPEGDYKVTMIGRLENNQMIKKDTMVHMVLWSPPKNEEILRFSIIYEFDESKAIMIYEKYLTDIVMPKIPKGAKVIIQGYTDITGDAEYNLNLSLARANDVKNTLAKALSNSGRTDVSFVVRGFGEDENVSLFENKLPEERFYNRTVLIDVIPSSTVSVK